MKKNNLLIIIAAFFLNSAFSYTEKCYSTNTEKVNENQIFTHLKLHYINFGDESFYNLQAWQKEMNPSKDKPFEISYNYSNGSIHCESDIENFKNQSGCIMTASDDKNPSEIKISPYPVPYHDESENIHYEKTSNTLVRCLGMVGNNLICFGVTNGYMDKKKLGKKEYVSWNAGSDEEYSLTLTNCQNNSIQ